MELIIKRKNRFLEGVNRLIREKSENFMQEERFEIKETAERATKKLKDDYLAPCSAENDILTIIDSYFLETPRDNDSKAYASRIISLLEVRDFDYIQIITNKVNQDVLMEVENYINKG